MELTDINVLKSLLARHNFRFSKSKGQNFLRAAWVPEQIAERSEANERTGVLEIGPGVGCLTVQLAKRAGKVLCVELDTALRPLLEETLGNLANVETVYGDIMKLDLDSLLSERLSGFDELMVCANLPYNITTPVITKLLGCGRFSAVTVMVQREVARRMCAAPATPDYGAFSLFVQWKAEPEPCFDVPPSCFIPEPKVTSSVVRLKVRERPPVETADEKLMFELIRAAFGQRRKTLQNAVFNALGGRFSKEKVAKALRDMGFLENVRGEQLALSDFARLAGLLQA